MYLLIDNYDSFTYNLVHFLGELGAQTEVYRNDEITVERAIDLKPSGIILSPGPCDPPKAGICMPLVTAAIANSVPVLGVCLGHQSIGQSLGATIERGPAPVHGKVWDVRHDGTGLFQGLPNPMRATRYHSLTIGRNGLPDILKVTAETDDGVIMGIEHREKPVYGVQFHPESIASEGGHDLLRNFLDRTRN